ncbi:MAG: DUF1329 domain-containing protein [Candidatus Binataceae bacterium]|nr:DUF1329 domain-containing protein [Candidatus Binataceae bacterium]
MKKVMARFPLLIVKTCGLLVLSLALLLSLPVSHGWAEEEGSIPPGTVITMQNWRQYKGFMSDGMQALFEGTYHWKFPSDFQLDVGPTHHYTLPEAYRRNTEKYSHLVKIVTLPDGRHTLTGYVAGQPFPNPQEPMRGYKILANLWEAYVPTLVCNPSINFYIEDRFDHVSRTRVQEVYRRLAHISDAKLPIVDPNGQGVSYAEYLTVVAPEQAKYVTQLTLYYNVNDFLKPEDLFLFLPSLRRTLRLSSAARCSPVFGSDWTQDDVKTSGFNGGLTRFDANYLGDRKVLGLTQASPKVWGNVDSNYYLPIVFPSPKVGQWEVRDTMMLDVRRIPSQRKGYCYGKRILYIDKEGYMSLWAELYDENMKLWKILTLQSIAGQVPGVGEVMNAYHVLPVAWDIQNDHLTAAPHNDPDGVDARYNEQCRSYGGHNWDDLGRYSSVRGLSEIMR